MNKELTFNRPGYIQIPQDKIEQIHSLIKETLHVGREIGIRNILDKNHYRSVIMAYHLNHNVNTYSCGRNFDAYNDMDVPQEYKSAIIESNHQQDFKCFGKLPTKNFLYSSAVNENNLKQVVQQDHDFGYFSREGHLYVIITVERHFVYDTLHSQRLDFIQKNKIYNEIGKSKIPTVYHQVSIKQFNVRCPPPYIKVKFINETVGLLWVK